MVLGLWGYGRYATYWGYGEVWGGMPGMGAVGVCGVFEVLGHGEYRGYAGVLRV